MNPSGKLPTTLAIDRADYADFGNFPGKDGIVNYAEGIYVGYRHFDKKGIEPLFPFGFGLSYTTFDYKNVRLSESSIGAGGTSQASVDVTNTGTARGKKSSSCTFTIPIRTLTNRWRRQSKASRRLRLRRTRPRRRTSRFRRGTWLISTCPASNGRPTRAIMTSRSATSSRDIRGKTTLRASETFTEPVPLSQEQTETNKAWP